MSFNTAWNVDQYKTEHECDDHWELRRSFMMAHKDKFDEDQLVCLAQVFTNIEFLGCRYPTETMQLVASLSQGVADGYREKQKGRLQRTFIQASDAAGAKAKGLKRPLQEEGASGSTSSIPASSSSSSQQQKKITPDVNTKPVTVNARLESNFTPKSQGGSSKLAQVTYGPSVYPASQSRNSNVSSQSVSSANGSLRFDSSRYGGVKTYHIDQSSAGRPPRSTGPEIGGPFGKLVLIEPANEPVPAMQTIQKSTAMCQVPLCYKYGQEVSSEVSCNLYVNEKLLASSSESNKKLASRVAAEEGLKKLKETCYTIKTKLKFLSDTTIDKSLDISSNSGTEFADINVPVSDSSVGSKLLRLMGWSGGGLGKNAQGIEEPVRVQEHVNRAGLGLSRANSGGSDDRQFRDKVYRLMQDYAKGDSEYDLVFSSDFTVEERKTMHSIATRLKLKTKSYGKDEDRHLVVFKRRDMWETLEQLLRSSGSTERYDLIKPTGLTPSTFQ